MAPIRLISKRRKPSHALLRFDDDIAGTLLKIGVQLRKLRRAFLYTDATHLLRHSKSAFSKAPLPLSSAPSHDSEDPFSEKYLADRYLADLSTLSEKPPRGDSSQVRVCQLHEYKAIARSLAASFADDPVALYFVDTPDTAGWSPARKWALHLALMEVVVYMHLLDGLVTTCGADYGAVALWLPPGRDADSLSTFLRSGLWRLRWGGWLGAGAAALPADARDRFFRTFTPLLHDTKRRVLGDARDADSWYLVYLGTRPGARRMGHARALVEHVTARADAERKACYLESSKEMNVDIYRKFGFEPRDRVVLEQPAGRPDVPLEIMVREPLCSN
jgi:ribosomal protein S18 acetylase RimI-like enzyme